MDGSFKQKTGRREEKINSRHKTKQKKRSFVIWMKKGGGIIGRAPSHANYGNAPIAIGHHHFLLFRFFFRKEEENYQTPFWWCRHTKYFFFFFTGHKKTNIKSRDRSNKNGRAHGVVVVRDPLKENLQLFLEVAKKGVRVWLFERSRKE